MRSICVKRASDELSSLVAPTQATVDPAHYSTETWQGVWPTPRRSADEPPKSHSALAGDCLRAQIKKVGRGQNSRQHFDHCLFQPRSRGSNRFIQGKLAIQLCPGNRPPPHLRHPVLQQMSHVEGFLLELVPIEKTRWCEAAANRLGKER